MVNRVVTGAHYGLRDWLMQRITALVMAAYVLLMAGWLLLHPNVDYDAWTIKVLRRIAKAFDLTVKVSFEKFSSGIMDISRMTPESLKRTSRAEDLQEFSGNGFGREEIYWSKPVVTAQFNNQNMATSNYLSSNDIEYRVRKIA